MAEKKLPSIWVRHKSRIVLLALCAAITGTGLVTMMMHYRAVNAQEKDLISSMEDRLFDLRYRMRGRRLPTGKVGVLAIDEKSIQKFGRWPIARKNYTKIFENLKALGAGWVGLDVVYSEPERPLLEDIKENVTKLKALEGTADWQEAAKAELTTIDEVMAASLGDRAIAKAFEDYEKVVLGYFYYGNKQEASELGDHPFRGLDLMESSEIIALLNGGKELKDYTEFQAHGIVGNIAAISSHGKNFAYFNGELSSDGVFRWVNLMRTVDGKLMPSLALKVASLTLGREPIIDLDSNGVADVMLVNPDDDQDILHIPVDPYGRGQMLINHLGPGKTIRHFSLADVYDMSLTDEEKAAIKGMSLVLGPTAIGINDIRPNPFDTGFAGVEQHAAVIDNIIERSFMRRTESIYVTELGLIAAIGLFFTPLMIFTRAALSGVAVLLFLVGYYYFDKLFWFGRGEWVYMGMPFVQITSLFVGTTLYKYVTEERERRKTKGAFGMYLAPEVIEQVLQNPDALKPGGERKEVTVFFSDIRGFTTISESLTPEKLSELMVCYFTPMIDLVLKSRGVLDKLIGDAVMAFWGAPIDMPNHPEVAVRTSIEMLYALDKLRVDLPKLGFPIVDIGIGLNTGMMSVGNMGSPQRFSYTVMGDAVNLGSRLESKTKEYGVKILISESTHKRLTPSAFFTRDLDDMRVKGKLEPVKVFEVMRPDVMRSEAALKNLIGEFQLGRESYRARDWAKAKKHFLGCLTLRPDDGPADMYLRRIEACEEDPSLVDMNGVYTFKDK